MSDMVSQPAAAARLPCIKTTRVARCRTRNENTFSSRPLPAKTHLLLENKLNEQIWSVLGKNIIEFCGAYIFGKTCLVHTAQRCLASVRKYKCCLMPGVVNKGVQGVYGALYFLTVSSGGSQTGSEGQGCLQTLCFTPANSYAMQTLYLKTKFKSKSRPCCLARLPFFW